MKWDDLKFLFIPPTRLLLKLPNLELHRWILFESRDAGVVSSIRERGESTYHYSKEAPEDGSQYYAAVAHAFSFPD